MDFKAPRNPSVATFRPRRMFSASWLRSFIQSVVSEPASCEPSWQLLTVRLFIFAAWSCRYLSTPASSGESDSMAVMNSAPRAFWPTLRSSWMN